MSKLTIDGIENAVRQEEFTKRVVKAARDHLRVTEPKWDLCDVNVRTDNHPIDGPRVAVVMYFKDNGLALQ